MILLEHNGQTRHLIALFGTGLIGSTIAESLSRYPGMKTSFAQWQWGGDSERNSGVLKQHISVINQQQRIDRFSAVWCAGRAGFDATEISSELANFQAVLDWFKQLHEQNRQAYYSFHLTSSAGGLFENQQAINAASPTQPLRPYGELKLAQETLLLNSSWLQERHIYRPTSVYGYAGKGQRMGLIPTLISNGVANRVSTIYGHLDTLRDYVFNEDIGRFIGQQVIAEHTDNKPYFYLLGTARPASIFEIRQLIERQIQRKIYLQFRPDSSANTGNITLNSIALPRNWQASPLATGIAQVHQQLLRAFPAFEPKRIAANG